jgi:hypothetical protein
MNQQGANRQSQAKLKWSERLLQREKEKARMLDLFAAHNNHLTHQQCLDGGVSDPQGTGIDLDVRGKIVNCTFQQRLILGGNGTQTWTESIYELI